MQILVAGGGIAGLAFALGLHRHAIPCRVFESTSEMRELGVGITLLPHAMRELAALGLEDRLRAAAIENREWNRPYRKTHQLSDEDQKALLIVLDSMVMRSWVSKVMAEL